MGQHAAFGFLADPLHAGPAGLVPYNLPQSFRRDPLVQFCQRGWRTRSLGRGPLPVRATTAVRFSCGLIDRGVCLQAAMFPNNAVLIVHIWLCV